MEEWVDEEFETASFGDKRLVTRCKTLMKSLIKSPKESIAASCKGRAETAAAYRFIENPSVSFEKILKPHIEATKERISKEKTITVVQDTAGNDLTGHRGAKNLGHLEQKNMRGIFIHPSLAITDDGLVLGIINSECWSRNPEFIGKREERKDLPIEEKESFIWVKSIEETKKLAELYPDKLIINVGDREFDIYECLLLAVKEKENIKSVVRCAQDRTTIEEDEQKSKIFESAKHLPIAGTKEILVKRDNKYRNITADIYAGQIKIKAPYRKGKRLEDIEINVVYAVEKAVPPGQKAIEWLLLTTLNVGTLEETNYVLDTYSRRWTIEIYFKILKQGCQVEKLQLETKDRIMSALALYMIIAWREMYLMTLGRACPDISADIVFERQEWEAIYIIECGQNPPKEAPTLNEVIIMIAKQGGYLNRKNDPPPGPKVLWIGLRKLSDYVQMYEKLKSLQTCV
jgi:hypothetical protein